MKNMKPVIEQVDWELLRKQLHVMYEMSDDLMQDLGHTPATDTEETIKLNSHYEAVEGVVSMLEAMLDAAIDDGLCNVVLSKDEEI